MSLAQVQAFLASHQQAEEKQQLSESELLQQRRRDVRKHKRVVALIDLFWALYSKTDDGVVVLQEYTKVYYQLVRALYGRVKMDSAHLSVLQDWATDVAHSARPDPADDVDLPSAAETGARPKRQTVVPHVTRRAFIRSMCETAEQWTTSLDVPIVLHFLSHLYLRMTFKMPDAPKDLHQLSIAITERMRRLANASAQSSKSATATALVPAPPAPAPAASSSADQPPNATAATASAATASGSTELTVTQSEATPTSIPTAVIARAVPPVRVINGPPAATAPHTPAAASATASSDAAANTNLERLAASRRFRVDREHRRRVAAQSAGIQTARRWHSEVRTVIYPHTIHDDASFPLPAVMGDTYTPAPPAGADASEHQITYNYFKELLPSRAVPAAGRTDDATAALHIPNVAAVAAVEHAIAPSDPASIFAAATASATAQYYNVALPLTIPTAVAAEAGMRRYWPSGGDGEGDDSGGESKTEARSARASRPASATRNVRIILAETERSASARPQSARTAAFRASKIQQNKDAVRSTRKMTPTTIRRSADSDTAGGSGIRPVSHLTLSSSLALKNGIGSTATAASVPRGLTSIAGASASATDRVNGISPLAFVHAPDNHQFPLQLADGFPDTDAAVAAAQRTQYSNWQRDVQREREQQRKAADEAAAESEARKRDELAAHEKEATENGAREESVPAFYAADSSTAPIVEPTTRVGNLPAASPPVVHSQPAPATNSSSIKYEPRSLLAFDSNHPFFKPKPKSPPAVLHAPTHADAPAAPAPASTSTPAAAATTAGVVDTTLPAATPAPVARSGSIQPSSVLAELYAKLNRISAADEHGDAHGSASPPQSPPQPTPAAAIAPTRESSASPATATASPPSASPLRAIRPDPPQSTYAHAQEEEAGVDATGADDADTEFAADTANAAATGDRESHSDDRWSAGAAPAVSPSRLRPPANTKKARATFERELSGASAEAKRLLEQQQNSLPIPEYLLRPVASARGSSGSGSPKMTAAPTPRPPSAPAPVQTSSGLSASTIRARKAINSTATPQFRRATKKTAAGAAAVVASGSLDAAPQRGKLVPKPKRKKRKAKKPAAPVAEPAVVHASVQGANPAFAPSVLAIAAARLSPRSAATAAAAAPASDVADGAGAESGVGGWVRGRATQPVSIAASDHRTPLFSTETHNTTTQNVIQPEDDDASSIVSAETDRFALPAPSALPTATGTATAAPYIIHSPQPKSVNSARSVAPAPEHRNMLLPVPPPTAAASSTNPAVSNLLAGDSVVRAQTNTDLAAIGGSSSGNKHSSSSASRKRSVMNTSTLTRPAAIPLSKSHRVHRASLQSFYDEWAAPPIVSDTPLLTTTLLEQKPAQPITQSIRIRRTIEANRRALSHADAPPNPETGSVEIAAALAALSRSANRPAAYPSRWSLADRPPLSIPPAKHAPLSATGLMDFGSIQPTAAHTQARAPSSVDLLFHRRPASATARSSRPASASAVGRVNR